MKSIKIIKTGAYIPEIKKENIEIEKELNLEDGYIKKRTGIETRYYLKSAQDEIDMAKGLVRSMLKGEEKDIDLIITATTTPTYIMPGISNIIQKELGIKTCIAFDILAGCSGFINAIDVAKKYIEGSTAKKALVVGIEQLSKYVDKNDIGTSIILSDGAGAILIEGTAEEKKYCSKIETTIDEKEILKTYIKDGIFKLEMDGKEVYKYAVTETVKNIEELLQKSNETLENIKYIVPHQSNLKIIKSIANRLGTDIINKMYVNIDKIGNTFCASIPIALDEMIKKGLLQSGDKVILLGYGGGLNTASILIEI